MCSYKDHLHYLPPTGRGIRRFQRMVGTAAVMACFFFTFFSCSGDRRPKKIIPEDVMVSVLVDVHIYEAAVENLAVSADSLALAARANYDTIFARHHITRQQFTDAMNYYEDHPKEMDEMYTKVVDELSRKEADLNGQEPAESK